MILVERVLRAAWAGRHAAYGHLTWQARLLSARATAHPFSHSPFGELGGDFREEAGSCC